MQIFKIMFAERNAFKIILHMKRIEHASINALQTIYIDKITREHVLVLACLPIHLQIIKLSIVYSDVQRTHGLILLTMYVLLNVQINHYYMLMIQPNLVFKDVQELLMVTIKHAHVLISVLLDLYPYQI